VMERRVCGKAWTMTCSWDKFDDIIYNLKTK
jgi:hypothetical protein